MLLNLLPGRRHRRLRMHAHKNNFYGVSNNSMNMKYCYRGKQLCERDFLCMGLRELRHFYEIL